MKYSSCGSSGWSLPVRLRISYHIFHPPCQNLTPHYASALSHTHTLSLSLSLSSSPPLSGLFSLKTTAASSRICSAFWSTSATTVARIGLISRGNADDLQIRVKYQFYIICVKRTNRLWIILWVCCFMILIRIILDVCRFVWGLGFCF